MEWRDIKTCPDHTKAVFGYLDQFGVWYYTTFPSNYEPLRLGYTHWLEIIPPAAEMARAEADS